MITFCFFIFWFALKHTNSIYVEYKWNVKNTLIVPISGTLNVRTLCFEASSHSKEYPHIQYSHNVNAKEWQWEEAKMVINSRNKRSQRNDSLSLQAFIILWGGNRLQPCSLENYGTASTVHETQGEKEY